MVESMEQLIPGILFAFFILTLTVLAYRRRRGRPVTDEQVRAALDDLEAQLAAMRERARRK